jgi:hypothetical protein
MRSESQPNGNAPSVSGLLHFASGASILTLSTACPLANRHDNYTKLLDDHGVTMPP